MRLNVEISHKIGLPNYGSSGSTVGITVDVPEDLADALSKDPKKLRNQLAALQALARGLVEHDLALIAANAQAAAEENPQPTVSSRPTPRPARRFAPPNDEDGWPEPVEQPRPVKLERGSYGAKGFDSGANNAPPRNGRQLYPWAKKQEQAGVTGLVRRIIAYGKGEGWPEHMIDWDADQTKEVVAHLSAVHN